MLTSDDLIERRKVVRAVLEAACANIRASETNPPDQPKERTISANLCLTFALAEAGGGLRKMEVLEELEISSQRLFARKGQQGRQEALAVFEAWLEKFPD